jgi:ABC-type transporter Mla subunit MlaD
LKKNISDYLVALAVIVCSLVLLAALTIALSGYRLKKPTRTLQIDYIDVTGIHLASELRYAGAPAGHVIAIRLLTSKEREEDANVDLKSKNAVRVTMEVDNDVPPIPDDIRASIQSDTLLSDKFIALSAGSPIGSASPDGTKTVQELANNAIIQGYPGGLDQLLNGAGDLVPKINELLAGLQGNLKDVVPRLDKVLDSAHKAVADGDTLLNNANSLVGDKGSLRLTLDQMHEAVAKLEGVEDNLNDVLKKSGGLVTDVNGNIDSRMKELAVVLENLKVATTYLKAFTKQLGEKPNRVIFSGKAEKMAPEEEIIKSQKPVPATAPTPTPAQ